MLRSRMFENIRDAYGRDETTKEMTEEEKKEANRQQARRCSVIRDIGKDEYGDTKWGAVCRKCEAPMGTCDCGEPSLTFGDLEDRGE